jgi:Na+-transporting NADH:ubiquinone oxidoreductase subunit C
VTDKIKTVIFTVFVTAIFSFVVAGVNEALADRIKMNKQVAQQLVILDLFDLATDTAQLDSKTIASLFSQKIVVDERFQDTGIEGFKVAEAFDEKLVCSFSGQGFWDTIKGYIAIDTSAISIQGIEFTQHGETPGLGGRITEKDFKMRFHNIPFDKVRDDGLRLKFVAEGTAKKTDEIDGITGASGTTAALEKIVNRTLKEILQITRKGAIN